jgi:uncharacterized membrane protein YfcA
MQALLGFLIAVIIGMTGAGGGSLVVTVLVLLCGMPAAEAVGTSMVFGTIVKLLSAPTYVVRRQYDARALIKLLAGGLPGVIAGSLLLRGLRTPGLQHAVLAIVGGTISISAIASLRRLLGRGAPSNTHRNRLHWLPWIALPIGLQVGFSSAGAGALAGVTLISLTPLDPAVVVGTDLLFGLCLSAAGSGLHLAFGNVDGRAAAQLLAGGAAGALLGPWLAVRVPVRTMRAALSIVLSILGAELFWSGVASLLS